MAASDRERRGRPRALDARQCEVARELFGRGLSVDAIARKLDVSRATIYRYRASWNLPVLHIGLFDMLGAPADFYNRFPEGAHPAYLDVRLAQRLAERLGARVRFTPTSMRALVAGVRGGAFDFGLGLLGNSPSRSRVVSFSEPYANLVAAPTGALVARRSRAFSPLDPRSLESAVVGSTDGTLSAEWAARALPDTTTLRLFQRPEITHRALTKGRVDAVLESLPIQESFVATHPAFEIKDPLIAYGPVQVAAMMAQDNLVMKARLNESLDALRDEGVLEALESASKPLAKCARRMRE
jgi:ABC-type amino acid transport substrate-binding protein